jgi:hypothetical protein
MNVNNEEKVFHIQNFTDKQLNNKMIHYIKKNIIRLKHYDFIYNLIKDIEFLKGGKKTMTDIRIMYSIDEINETDHLFFMLCSTDTLQTYINHLVSTIGYEKLLGFIHTRKFILNTQPVFLGIKDITDINNTLILNKN